MSDLYLRITEQPEDVLDAIASSMDKRAAEPAMREIAQKYMGRLPNPGADVLEIGCGNGASTQLIVENLRPRQLTAIDPSEGLLERARARLKHLDNVRFELADARDTKADDASFDVVVAHTVYSHLAHPEAALAEAFRVLRRAGVLAVFDGDYATNTVALFDGDPLQAAMMAAQRNLIHDPYIMRRLPRLAEAAGFVVRETLAHGYLQTNHPEYLLSLMARGVDAAAAAGECGAELAEGLKAEAGRRVKSGTFYGAILFVTLFAERHP